jgi:Viral BACON domain
MFDDRIIKNYLMCFRRSVTTKSRCLFLVTALFCLLQPQFASALVIPIAEAVDTDGKPIVWSTVGSPAWAGQTAITHDGVDAAQSGAIGDNGAVTLQTTLSGPGTLTFWWKVSSETNRDFVKFFTNGVQQMRISGEVGWQSQTLRLPPGPQVLKWTYAKNGSLSAGQDCGWLDQVAFVPDEACSYGISPNSRTHQAGSETGMVSVVAGTSCGWAVVNTNDWVSIVSGTNGFGSNTVTYLVASNPVTIARSGYLQVAGQPFSISQQGGTCTFVISPTNRTHGAGSETGTVVVTTLLDCSWSVVNTNSWVGIPSSSNHLGSETLTYLIATNASDTARTGFVSIAGETLIISQLPALPANSLVSLPEALDTLGFPFTWSVVGNSTWFGQSYISHDGVDAAQTGAVPDGGAVTLQTSVIGPGTISFWWKVSSEPNKDGLKFFINGAQQVRITGEVDWKWQTYNLASGSQILKWTYSKDASGAAGWDRGWVDQVQFIPLGGCLFELSSTGNVHGAGAEMGTFRVSTSTNCVWSIANSNSWITITSSTNNLGTGVVTYAVAANVAPVQRTAFLNVADQVFAVNQSGAITGPQISIVSMSADGGVVLKVQGQAGQTNVIQSSSDLVLWTSISTNVMPSTVCPTCPSVGVTDKSTQQNVGRRFYRAMQLP